MSGDLSRALDQCAIIFLAGFIPGMRICLVTNAVDVAAEDLHIGMQIEIFIDGEGRQALPRVKTVPT